MEIRKLKNKKDEILTTKDGVELEELRFEVGDEFIPCYNSVMERINKHTDEKGEEKSITNYTIRCTARDKEGKQIEHRGEKEIYVVLTPTQAKSLKKKIEDNIELNQNMFVAYNYQSKEHGQQIGVGLKNLKPAKTFSDFEDAE